MFGLPLETIYFYVLIFCAVLSVLVMIIGDVFSVDGPLDPVLILPLFAITALLGYFGERSLSWNSWLILALSLLVALIIVFILNFYVVIPLKNAETTLMFSEKELEGRMATVITPIPVNSMGEIRVKAVTGNILKPAKLYHLSDHEIGRNETVLIVEIKKQVAYVVPYEENFKIGN